jgi:S1-C subfamily serine protease
MAALALALVYEWRKTLLTPILLHAAVNAVGIVFLAWSLAADAAAPRIGVLGEARQGGCLVTVVVPGSAADAAGIQVGDVITVVYGEPVADIPGIARVIRKHQVGDAVSVEFLRGGTAHRADVVLVRLRR